MHLGRQDYQGPGSASHDLRLTLGAPGVPDETSPGEGAPGADPAPRSGGEVGRKASSTPGVGRGGHGDDNSDPPGAMGTGGIVGVSVLVLRPRDGEEEEGGKDRLVQLLVADGHAVIHHPLTASEPPRDPRPLARAVRRWEEGAFDVLLLTSPRTARTLGPLITPPSAASVGEATGTGIPREVWAVGPSTARAAEGVGLRVDRVPAHFLAEGLLEEAPGWRELEGLRILFPRAEEGRDLLPEGLSGMGARVTLVAAYRNAPVSGAAEGAAARLRRGEVEVVVLTAGSQARALARGWRARAGGDPWPREVRFVVIGGATEAAARGVGIPVTRVAEPHTLEGVAGAVRALVRRAGRLVEEGEGP